MLYSIRHSSLLVLLVLTTGSAGAFFEDKDARVAILEMRKQIDAMRLQSERIEVEMQQIQQTIGRLAFTGSEDSAQIRRVLLELQSQTDGLRQELAKAAGDRDLLQRELTQMQIKAKEQAPVAEDRMRKTEPVPVKIDGVDTLVDPSELKDYESALASFRKGDFATVASLYTEFLSHYPKSPYRIQALFWLGNAQYATKAYKEAISSFSQVVKTAPQHMHAPESWLAIANCQIELKDPKAAKATLAELIKAHPKSEAAKAAKERMSKLK